MAPRGAISSIRSRSVGSTWISAARAFDRTRAARRVPLRDDVLGKCPGREPAGVDLTLAGEVNEGVDDDEVRRHVLVGELGRVPAHVPLVELCRCADRSRQQSATERAERDEGRPELATRLEDFVLGEPVEDRVLGLQRGDRELRVGAAKRLRVGLGEPDRPDLSFFDEPSHRADGLLDRDVGVDPVEVVEVDGVDSQPLEAAFDRAALVGPPIRAHPAVGELESELRRDDDLVPSTLQDLTEEALVVATP